VLRQDRRNERIDEAMRRMISKFPCYFTFFSFCHSEEALRPCHSERREESHRAQGKLREEPADPSLSLRVTTDNPAKNLL